MVLRVLDQMSLMPPVGADRVEMRPWEMVLSSSARKEAAMSCLRSAKALRWARMALTSGVASMEAAVVCCCFFIGLRAVGFFFGLAVVGLS